MLKWYVRVAMTLNLYYTEVYNMWQLHGGYPPAARQPPGRRGGHEQGICARNSRPG